MIARNLRSLHLAFAAVLVATASSCSCGNSSEKNIGVTITSPTNGAVISQANDVDASTPGIQISVKVHVTNVTNKATASFAVNGLVIAGLDKVALQAAQDSGEDIAENVTVPAGSDAIVVKVNDASTNKTGSAVANISVTAAAQCTFVTPANGSTVTADEDSSTPVFNQKVTVQCPASLSGLTGTLQVAVLVGSNRQNLAPATTTLDATGLATFDKAALGEGTNALAFTASDSTGAAQGTANETVTVSTGRCPLIDSDPTNVIYNVAGGAPPDPSETRPAVADADPNTPGIQEPFTGYVDMTTCPGAAVTLIINGAASTAVCAVASDGKFTCTNATLPDGDPVTVQAHATSGSKTGDSVTSSYGVDSVVPQIAITNPNQSTLGPSDDLDPNTVGLQVSLVANGGTTVDAATYVGFSDSVNGASATQLVAGQKSVCNTTGVCTIPGNTTLPMGQNAIVATATRRLGNAGSSPTYNTNVTQSSLSVTLIRPDAGSVNCTQANDEDPSTADCDLTMEVQVDPSARTVDFVGASPDGGLAITGGQTGVVPDGGFAQVQFHIPQGQNFELTATAHDLASNTASVSVAVPISDTLAPTPAFTSPTDGATLSGQSQQVCLHITNADLNDQVTLTLQGQTGNLSAASVSTLNSDGSADVCFSPNPNLPLGVDTLVASISDPSGNTGTQSVTVTVITNGQCDLNITGGSPQVFNIAGTQASTDGGSDRVGTLSGNTTLCKGLQVTVSKVIGNGAPQVVATATTDGATGDFTAPISFADNEIDDTLVVAVGTSTQAFSTNVIYTADFTPPSIDSLLPAAGVLKVVPNGDARGGSNGFVADESASTPGGQFTPTIQISGAGQLGTLAETGTGSLTITGDGLPSNTGLGAITSNSQQTFNSQLSFADGAAQTVTITATDAAGNSVSQTWSVAVASQVLPGLTLVDPSGTLNVFADLKSNRTDRIDYHGYVTALSQIPSGTEIYICTTTATPGASVSCKQASPAGTQVPGSDETFGSVGGPAPAASAFWADLTWAQGSYQSFAEAVSAVGDVVDSAPVNLTVDSVPPVVTSVTLTQDTNSDGVLNAAELSAAGGTLTFVVNITGADGQTATLTGGPSSPTATVTNGTATFTLSAASLVDGRAYTFKVLVQDAAGNPNESTAVSPPITNPTDALSLRVETGAPSASVISPTTLVCNAASPGADVANHLCNVTFTVSVADESGVAVTEVDFSGPGAPSSNVVTPTGGLASASYAVPEGPAQTLVATVKDAAGNSTQVTVTLLVDVTAPQLTISSPSSGANETTQNFTVTVSGALPDGTAVTVLSSATSPANSSIGSGTFVGGTATVTVHAPAASNQQLVATATDAAGNPGTSTPVTLSVTQPGCDLQLTNPPSSTLSLNVASGNALNVQGYSNQCAGINQTVTFFAQVGAGARQQVGTTTIDATGHFSFPYTFTDGAVTIFTAETVNGGDTTDASFTATVDATAPTIQINSPTQPGSGPLYIVAQTGNRHVAANDPGYVPDASALTGGQVNVGLTITGGGSATGTGGGTLTVKDGSGNALIAPVPITSNGTVQFAGSQLQITLAQAYQGPVTFTVTDAAGNSASASWTSVAVDVVPPPVPTLITSDPGDGGYTHVVNSRNADLDVAFTTPTDDGLAGQTATVEFGYATSAVLDGGTLDEASYDNSALTTKVPVSPSPIVNLALDSVPPLNTYYLAPRAVDSVGNVSSLAVQTLDVNWTKSTIPYAGSNSSSAYFGLQIAAGDIDGDGRADVAIFAFGENSFQGAVTVAYGGPFPLTRTQTITGTGPFFGQGLTLGDINGDGLADLILINGDHAEAYLATASGLPQIPSFSITGDSGVYIADVAHDLNGDGIKDLVLTAPTSGSGGTAYIFYGRANWSSFGGTVASADITITESTSGARLGGVTRGIASVTDIDGDGRDELFLGEPGIGRGLVFLSSSIVAHGSGDVSSFNPIIIAPTSPLASFGDAVEALDANGDGLTDLFIGTNTPTGTLSRVLQGPSENFLTPVAIATGSNDFAEVLASGKLNGDGASDLAVGESGNGKGEVRVFFSGGAIIGGEPSGAVWGGNGFGNGLAVGDVDGDGKPDLIVSEPGVGNGSVYVYH